MVTVVANADTIWMYCGYSMDDGYNQPIMIDNEYITQQTISRYYILIVL